MERAEAQVGEAGTMKRDNTDAAGRGSHHRMLMRGLAAFGAEDSVRAVAHCCQRNGLIINYTLSRARDVPVYAPKIQLEEPGQASSHIKIHTEMRCCHLTARLIIESWPTKIALTRRFIFQYLAVYSTWIESTM